jgi:hypothetical protein
MISVMESFKVCCGNMCVMGQNSFGETSEVSSLETLFFQNIINSAVMAFHCTDPVSEFLLINTTECMPKISSETKSQHVKLIKL